MKKIVAVLAIAAVLAVSMAIQPASDWTKGQEGKYTPTPAPQYTTEGGNVTEVNLTGNVSTEKWAGVYGDVSGTVVLARDSGHVFYDWTWDSSSGGVVCASVGSNVDWTNVQTRTAAEIDSDWGFSTTDVDSASNTFSDNSCTITISGTSYTTAGAAVNGGTFTTCALYEPGEGDNMFCTDIHSGGSVFTGGVSTADYALLLATPETAGSTETYYFWLELH